MEYEVGFHSILGGTHRDIRFGCVLNAGIGFLSFVQPQPIALTPTGIILKILIQTINIYITQL